MPLLTSNHTLAEIPGLLFTALRKGTVQKNHPFRNVVLSTVKDGLPKSRWVVCRSWTEDQHCLIYTDARSSKVAELEQQPECSLLFYHNRYGLQIRMEGVAVIHKDNALTQRYWPGVRGNSVKNYTTVEAPGTPIQYLAAGPDYQQDPTDAHFRIIEATPQRLEVLQLDRDAPIRAAFTWVDDEWKGTFLVP